MPRHRLLDPSRASVGLHSGRSLILHSMQGPALKPHLTSVRSLPDTGLPENLHIGSSFATSKERPIFGGQIQNLYPVQECAGCSELEVSQMQRLLAGRRSHPRLAWILGALERTKKKRLRPLAVRDVRLPAPSQGSGSRCRPIFPKTSSAWHPPRRPRQKLALWLERGL